MSRTPRSGGRGDRVKGGYRAVCAACAGEYVETYYVDCFGDNCRCKSCREELRVDGRELPGKPGRKPMIPWSRELKGDDE